MATPKWFEKIRLAIVDSALKYVIEAAIGAGIAAVAAYRSLATTAGAWAPVVPYLVGVCAVFVFGIILLAINQYKQLRDSAKKERMAQRTPAEIERQIREWLYKYKYQIKDANTPETRFNMLVTNRQDLKFNIMLPKETPFVVIATKTTIPRGDDLYKTVKSAGSTFRFDVGIALAQLGVEFDMSEPDKGVEVLLQRPILFDEAVTDLSLMREIMLVHRGLSIFNFLAGRATIGSSATPQLPPTSKRGR
jgi:hypothetical protein